MTDLGDPSACERAAADCDRAARQLDGPIGRLTSVRGNALDAFRGTAGYSLVSSVDARRQSLVQAQGQLHHAAGRLRTAAAVIREAIRLAEHARLNRPASPRALSPDIAPLGPAV